MTTRPAIAVVWFAVAAVPGCTLNPPAPEIEAVSPAWGYNGEATSVVIDGANFFPTVIVSEASEEGGRIEGAFQAWLEGPETVALEAVRHTSYVRLEGVVPAGLPVGEYDLRVEVPTGLDVVKEGAFDVTDTRADHLQFSVVTVAYTAGDVAQLFVDLRDPAGNVVRQDLDIEVTAGSATGATGVLFSEGDLEDQQGLTTGRGVRGRLGEDGSATLLVTSETADDVEFVVLPAEDASVVRGDSLLLTWDPGAVQEVELTLPEPDFVATVGEPFALGIRLLDGFGNVLSTEPADLLLSDHCLSAVEPVVSIVGEGSVEVTLTQACDEDYLAVYAYDRLWESETFAVDAGPVVTYDVRAVRSPISAGGFEFVIVEALDTYGNRVERHDATLELTDDVGGLDPRLGMGTQSCEAFADGAAVCSAYPWVAAPAVTIRATDENGIWGASQPIEILAAAPDSLLLDVLTNSVAAGEPFDATVRVIDAYGNSVNFDPGGTDPVVFLDDTGTIACRWVGAVEGVQNFVCTIEGATSSAGVEARVLGLEGVSPDLLQVTNAELSVVDLTPVGSGFVAGVPFTLVISGFDAFGNPYVTQTDPVVDLEDGAGMIPDTATLGASGTVPVSVTLYGAGSSVEVRALQAGEVLGTSEPFTVSPADMIGFSVDAAPWFDVDALVSIRVAAVDDWDNPVPEYAGVVTLTSLRGACEGTEISAFEDGVAWIDLVCDSPTLGEALAVADDAGFEGESDVFDVLDFGCTDGPLAAIDLAGDTSAIECLPSGGSVSVDMDLGASVAGGAALSVFHYSDGEDIVTRTSSDVYTATYDTPGTREVEAVVADADACADVIEGVIYVGEDDDEPTGRVAIDLAATVLSTGSVTVSVSAVDCTRDRAAGQELLVRADLGDPAGTSTGEGLILTLDPSGESVFTWQFSSGYAGTATIYLASETGGAYGAGAISVTGDGVFPQVVSVSPSGETSGDVDAVVVTFSEPMYAGNLTGSAATLTGPSGRVSLAYSLASDLKTLTLTPVSAVNADAGMWTLALSSNIRDVAGNRLDGTWSGAPAAFSATFGVVGNTLPTVTSCTADVDRFVPDGDAGAGDEADEVTVTPTATSTPTWWWLQVLDADGAQVRSLRAPGTDASVAWDGRGDDGLVTQTGQYVARIRAVDGNANIGDTCDVEVELGQHLDAP